MNKRRLLVNVLSSLGGLRVLAVHNRRRIRILNYHRILPASTRLNQIVFDREVYDVTAKLFEWQLDYLAENYAVISLDEFGWHMRRRTSPTRDSVLLTFDDGYVDIYQEAFPRLNARRLSAVFFIPTQRITERRLETWEKVSFCMHNSPLRKFDIAFRQWHASGDLSDDNAKGVSDVCRIAVEVFDEGEDEFVRHVARSLNSRLPTEAEMEEQIVTEAQMREMANAGMAFGSHTHRHAVLAKLRGDRLNEELCRSKEILEDIVGVRVEALSYPHGKRDVHYNRETLDAAKGAGFRLGFNYMGGLVRPDVANPMDVNRIPVNLADIASFTASLQGVAM